MEVSVPRGKIIQKRVQKKERYAKMVRIRQRKQAQIVLAGVQPIQSVSQLIKAEPSSVKKYELPMGFYVAEKDGKLDIDMSLINKEYTTNCIDVYEDADKILSINLNKKDFQQKDSTFNTDFLEEWEQRDTPYWQTWVNRLKNFSSAYKDFVEKHKDKFRSNKHDKQNNQKYEDYVARCREIMKYKPTTEVVKSFNADSFGFSKINFNSKLIENLHYDFNEFINLVLKSGLPRLRQSKVENGGMFGLMMDKFASIFEKPIMLPPKEAVYGLKSGDLQRVSVNVMIAGHFVKNTAEVSFFVSLDMHKPIPISPSSLNPHMMSLTYNTLNDHQRQQFFARYYPILYTQFIADLKTNSQKRQNVKLCIDSDIMVKTEDESTSNSERADSYAE